jgi:hypothetical protein
MKTELLRIATQESVRETPAHARKIQQGILSRQRLWAENLAYAKTGGVSQENRHSGFSPAYLDALTGTVLPSRYSNGDLAPIHVLDGLPPRWVRERDPQCRVLKARPGIIAGFLRDGRFYTRDEAAALTVH